jgi:hypothetical protein
MDKVQKPGDSECYAQSSQPFSTICQLRKKVLGETLIPVTSEPTRVTKLSRHQLVCSALPLNETNRETKVETRFADTVTHQTEVGPMATS